MLPLSATHTPANLNCTIRPNMYIAISEPPPGPYPPPEERPAWLRAALKKRSGNRLQSPTKKARAERVEVEVREVDEEGFGSELERCP